MPRVHASFDLFKPDSEVKASIKQIYIPRLVVLLTLAFVTLYTDLLLGIDAVRWFINWLEERPLSLVALWQALQLVLTLLSLWLAGWTVWLIADRALWGKFDSTDAREWARLRAKGARWTWRRMVLILPCELALDGWLAFQIMTAPKEVSATQVQLLLARLCAAGLLPLLMINDFTR